MGPNILISQNLESEKEVSNREVEAKSDNAGNTPNSIYTNQNLRNVIQTTKYTVISSQKVHFVTILPVPPIKNLILQNLSI